MLLPAELWSYTLVASNISSSGRIWSQFGFLFICYLFIHLIKVVISLFSKQFWRNTLVKTNCFLYLQQTIGAAFGAKKVTVGNKCVTLGIWVSYLFILQYKFTNRSQIMAKCVKNKRVAQGVCDHLLNMYTATWIY